MRAVSLLEKDLKSWNPERLSRDEKRRKMPGRGKGNLM